MERLRKFITLWIIGFTVFAATPRADAVMAVGLKTVIAPIPRLVWRAWGVTLGMHAVNYVFTWGFRDPFIGFFAFIGGVAALDASDDTPIIHLNAITTDEQAALLHLSPDELTAYNQQLPLINLAMDELTMEIKSNPILKDPSIPENLKVKTAQELARGVAKQVGLSAMAVHALKKVLQESLAWIE